jgi:hypothetical protein
MGILRSGNSSQLAIKRPLELVTQPQQPPEAMVIAPSLVVRDCATAGVKWGQSPSPASSPMVLNL